MTQKLVIAATLTQPKLKANTIKDLYLHVVKHYTHYSPTLIITHCDGSADGVACIDFHPNSFLNYLKYIIKVFVLVLQAIISSKRNTCILIIWGTVFAPLVFVFKNICKKIIIVELGDWPEVLYWKTFYTKGQKFAKIIKNTTLFIEMLIFKIVDEVVTNTFTVAIRAGSKVRIRLQPLLIKTLHINCKNKRNIILYVGRLDVEKGIHLLIKAYINYIKQNSRHKLRLVIAGGGMFRALITKVANKGLIDYLGFLDTNRISELYCSAKAVIIPSYTEGFPTVLLEAVLHRVPLIILNAKLKYIADLAKQMFKEKGVNIKYFKDEYELTKILLENIHNNKHV